MRIHTYLNENEMRLALMSAKRKGHIADDVRFDPIQRYGSRTHEHAWEVQLGTNECSLKGKDYKNQFGRPQKTRRTRNSSDMAYRYAATWHEWGWFLNEIFDMDNTAHAGRIYRSRADFDQQTKFQFTEETPARESGMPYVVPRDDIDHATRINRESRMPWTPSHP